VLCARDGPCAQREIGTGRAQMVAQDRQRFEEELDDRRADARAAQQRGVENEDARDALAALGSGKERRMIVDP
jgi:hypothetical protein